MKARGEPPGYVEGLNDARTLLADFFGSLLVLVSIGEGSTMVNVSRRSLRNTGGQSHAQLHGQHVESWLKNGVALFHMEKV